MNAVGLILYPVSDASRAKTFFTALLGTEPYHEGDYYIGYKPGDVEIGLLPPVSAGGKKEAVAYVTVGDIKVALAALLAAGAELTQDVTDVAQGLLVATVKDPDGNAIGLRQFPSS